MHWFAPHNSPLLKIRHWLHSRVMAPCRLISDAYYDGPPPMHRFVLLGYCQALTCNENIYSRSSDAVKDQTSLALPALLQNHVTPTTRIPPTRLPWVCAHWPARISRCTSWLNISWSTSTQPIIPWAGLCSAPCSSTATARRRPEYRHVWHV